MEEKEIKEAMIEALTHLEGCKYFVATIVNEEERRFDMSLRMSQHQLALIIKGILSNNEMMMMDVLQWCSERIQLWVYWKRTELLYPAVQDVFYAD